MVVRYEANMTHIASVFDTGVRINRNNPGVNQVFWGSASSLIQKIGNYLEQKYFPRPLSIVLCPQLVR